MLRAALLLALLPRASAAFARLPLHRPAAASARPLPPLPWEHSSSRSALVSALRLPPRSSSTQRRARGQPVGLPVQRPCNIVAAAGDVHVCMCQCTVCLSRVCVCLPVCADSLGSGQGSSENFRPEKILVENLTENENRLRTF